MTAYLTDGTDVTASIDVQGEDHFKEIQRHTERASGGGWWYVLPSSLDEVAELQAKLRIWENSLIGQRVA